ncbi:MAG: VanZ family protein [Lentimicrobium sp.]|nr:VanZ family protein [Lentimicrobium sp.]
MTLPLNTSDNLNNITILQLRGDYFLHILLFMPWAFFRQACKIKTLPWLLLGLLFAAGTEGLQYFLPWRAFNVNDLLANGLGVLLSLLSVKLMKISKHWRSKVKL